MNSQTEANIVFEAESALYGSIVVKFTPSEFFFHKEYTYYRLAAEKTMAEMIGFDKEYNVIILKRIMPGFQVKFSSDNQELRGFFNKINSNLIEADKLQGDTIVPNIELEFDQYAECAGKQTYAYDIRKSLEEKAKAIYRLYFDGVPLFYLHRDLHHRNILKCDNGIRAIDPRGAIGPREFEYVIQLVIEIRSQQEQTEKLFWEMFGYFKVYTQQEHYLAALFYFFVYKANDYTFQKNDGYKLAQWCIDSIRLLFFDNDSERMTAPAVLPDFKGILLRREKND